MARRLGLPLRDQGTLGTPTVERARQRLGGRGVTDTMAGAIVTVQGSPLRGVVVFSNEQECDVFLEAGFVKRTRRANVEHALCEAESPLHELSGEARLFASLDEGKRVRFEEPEKGQQEGLLFEKCRYGALVAKDDGTIVAVGFRKLWPAIVAVS
jgi:hypothetical protein